MKRRTLCVFSLLAWVLAACTMLSFKIEEQMTAQVVAAPRSAYGLTVLPMKALTYDETGYHLFELVEGSGWESGPRAHEIDGQDYSIIDREGGVQQVTATPSYNAELIQFSSHPLRAGEPLVELLEQETAEDVYLVAFSAPVPEIENLSPSLRLDGRTDTALLLSVAGGAQPFIEPQAKTQISQAPVLTPYFHPMTADYARVYSLKAVEQFLEHVPRLVLLLVMLLFPVVLWAGSCILFRRRGGRGLAAVNTTLAGLDGVCMAYVLDGVELPPSLLPAEMIFDAGHYTDTFGNIFEALMAFGENPLAKSVLCAAEDAFDRAAVILFVGLMAAVFVVIAEGLLCRGTWNKQGKLFMTAVR